MRAVDAGDLRLLPLLAEHEHSARAAAEELAPDGFEFLLGLEPAVSWSDYVARLADNRCGRRLADGQVPSTFLGAFVGGELVGRTSIRHELNPFLERQRGHIGFGVRPRYRRRGVATEVLRQSLVLARAAGVHDVLVTCDDDNIGSAAVIERCGGRLDDRVEPADGGTLVRRYWIR